MPNDPSTETAEESSHPREGYGYFCRVSDEQHFQRIHGAIEKKGYFTDRVLYDRVTVHQSDLVLLVSPKRQLAYAAHVRPTRAGSTGNRGFRAESLVSLDITQAELADALPADVWSELRDAFTLPSLRPGAKAWHALWNALKRLRPDKAKEFRRLEQLRFDAAFEFDTEGRGEQHFYEKDAVGVALAVSGIEFHGVFAELSDGLAEDKPLLQALCGNTSEDVHVDHDTHNFLPGYVREDDLLHSCEFRQGPRKVTIFNVNRRPAEKALGVDVIYHNETFGSFTFIQYKMLENGGSRAFPDWRYRPDEQFDAELGRMKRAHGALAAHAPTAPDRYRLSGDPFFFKFCRRQYLKVNAGTLVHGHYLTLTHLQLVLSHAADGPRGGTVLTPGAMGRWLTRTDFARLVADGWIGTSEITTQMLADYVEASLNTGHSVIVARGRARSDSEDDEEDEQTDD